VLRLDRWRHALALPAGMPSGDTLNQLRAHLADDLDTPGALAAVDAWAIETLDGRGRDRDASPQLRAAADALLGIAL